MHKALTDQEMDAVVVRALSRLGAPPVSRQFADRVMARVALPQPGAVVLYHRARAWASQPAHALVLASGYAVMAVLALVVAVPWLLANISAIAFVTDWAVSRGAAVVRDGALAIAQWSVTSGLASLVASLPLSEPALWGLGLLIAAGYAGGAFGLHLLLRAPRRDDAIRVRA